MMSTKFTAVKPAVGGRRAVVPRAAADRRAILTGLAASVAVLGARPSQADNTAGFVDLFDDRKARKNGFDIIYEARDLDLVQNERDGLSQFRGDLKATKERYKEATKRISTDVSGYIDKAYWTEAKEELRRQVGNFRFDLKNLASARGTKPERKEALASAKSLIQACERLDYTFTKKDQTEAKREFAVVLDKLKSFDSIAAA